MDLSDVSAGKANHRGYPAGLNMGRHERFDTCRSCRLECRRNVAHRVTRHVATIWPWQRAIADDHRHVAEPRARGDPPIAEIGSADLAAGRRLVIGYDHAVRERSPV